MIYILINKKKGLNEKAGVTGRVNGASDDIKYKLKKWTDVPWVFGRE